MADAKKGGAKKGRLNKKRITAALRAKDVAELRKELAEEREKLMRDRFRHATAQLQDTASLRATRRQIARLETVLKEKQSEASA